MSLFSELKRRNVFRVGAAYAVAAWLLIQIAETIFPLFGFNDEPARVVVIVLTIGFPIVLVLSWIYELTPEGLKLERDVDRSSSVVHHTGKKLDRAIIVVLVLALGYFAFDKFVLAPQRDIDITESATKAGVEQAREEARLGMFNDKSIAVLPFTNRSEQKEDEYFTDGMHDELLTRLSRIAELTVISRTSVMRFRDTLRSIPDIAKELSVATILEGGVQRSGDHVRINVQLIDAHTDEHLWAEIYDRELTTDNLFAIQSEISTAIADALQATLSPEEQSQIYDLPTANMAAYNHFLRGRQYMASRRKLDLEQAHKEFEQATELDPEFVLAWVGMADVVRLLNFQGAFDRNKYEDVHKQAVEKAVALNDQLGEVYTSLASHYEDLGEEEKAEAAYLRAIELNPNYVQAYVWYAISRLVSREQKLQLLYKAAQLDPLSLLVQRNLVDALVGSGQTEEGQQVMQDILQRNPEFSSGYQWLGNIDADNGRLAQAIQWFRKAQRLNPGNGHFLYEAGVVFLALGDFEAAADILAEMNKHLGPGNHRSDALEYWTTIAQSDWQKGLNKMAGLPEEVKDTPEFWWGAAWFLMYAGDFEQSLHYLLKAEAYLADREQWQQEITDTGRFVCDFVGIMIEGGEEALGQELLQLIITNIEEQRAASGNFDFVDSSARATCHLLAGSIDKSLDILEQEFVEEPFRLQWWYLTRKMPWWKRLDDHPRYLAVVEQMESKLAEQRALLKEMEESGSHSP